MILAGTFESCHLSVGGNVLHICIEYMIYGLAFRVNPSGTCHHHKLQSVFNNTQIIDGNSIVKFGFKVQKFAVCNMSPTVEEETFSVQNNEKT